jgi:hypothetical protein
MRVTQWQRVGGYALNAWYHGRTARSQAWEAYPSHQRRENPP